MKRIIPISILILTVVLYSGCKKDSNTTPTPGIYGLWQVTSSTTLPTLKFVKFNSNKSLVAYSQTIDGFRSIVNTNYTPGTDQIIANFIGTYYYPTVYNYSVTGDVLTIIGDNGQTYLVATKSTSTDPDTWVTDVTSTDHIDALFTNNTQGIGFDGSNLLFADYTNGKIVKVSLATRSIIGDITASSSLNTVEYDGTDYWVSRNGWSNVYKVNSAGTTTFTSTATMGSWLYGIGYMSPTSLICYSNSDHTIYNYNQTTDVVTASKILAGISLGDIAISNGKIYIIQSSNNLIYRVNPATFAVEKTYRVADAVGINGIASVGSNSFWLNTNSGTTVLKVDLN